MPASCILMGGLGNNLFQIANLLAYSFKYNTDYCIPLKIDNPHSDGQEVFRSNKLNYCEKPISGVKCFYNEPSFSYTGIPKINCETPILKGYFQSERYFSEYRNEILNLLDIPYEFKKDWCSIHIRRGDYLNLPAYHPVVSNIYLQEAQMKMMQNGVGKFLVLSDDIPYCKEFMPQFDDADYEFSEWKTEVEDLSLASSCEHNIGSNSAFSFWIAYLNKNENKINIFPRKDRWFGKSLPHNVDDLYMKEWYLV